MVRCGFFYDELINNGIDFFCGVPDSLLKNICAYITDHAPEGRHVIAANEGNAVGLAMGHYLASGKPALVYMQNSGQGNAVNPIASLADPDVYGIPMVLMVGWRGEPGTKDEPQHVKQGKITLELFKTLGIPLFVLPDDEKGAAETLEKAVSQALTENRPAALIIKKGVFGDYRLKNKPRTDFSLSRERAIEIIADALPDEAVIVSTTGKPSRELYEIRDRQGRGHHSDFLTVGGMGHAAQIAAGIAIEKPHRTVCCLDGDGAVIMHMGGLGIIASLNLKNFKHIVLNNHAHDSVGGQPTVGSSVNFPKIARDSGYTAVFAARNEEELKKNLSEFLDKEGTVMLEVCVASGSRGDLGRPKTTPEENKKAFMEFVAHDV